MRDVVNWLHDLDFELRQRNIVKKRRFVELRNLKILAVLLRERDVFYAAVRDVWFELKRPRALGILTPVVYSYMTDKVQSKAGLKRYLILKIAGMFYHVMLLGSLLRWPWYGPIDHLAYPCMVNDWSGGDALLYVSLSLIKQWYALGTFWLIWSMAMDPMYALVALGRLTVIIREPSEDQECFPYNHDKRKSIVLQEKLPEDCCTKDWSK